MDEAYGAVLKRLANERKKHNMSQREVGLKLGMTQSHYSKAERGAKRLSYDALKTLSGMGFDMYYIFTGQTVSPQNFGFLLKCSYSEHLLFLENLYAFIEYSCGRNPDADWMALYENMQCMKFVIYIRHRNRRNVFYLIRQYRNYTQKQMAAVLGIDIKKYGMLEHDKILPDSEIIFRLFHEFQVSPLLVLEDERLPLYELLHLLEQMDAAAAKRVMAYYRNLNKTLL